MSALKVAHAAVVGCLGVIAFKSLRESTSPTGYSTLLTLLSPIARQQFGNLQHKTFPIYFGISIALSTGLLGLWTYSHPQVLEHATNPQVADVAQAYTLAGIALAQLTNQLVIGPLTSQ